MKNADLYKFLAMLHYKYISKKIAVSPYSFPYMLIIFFGVLLLIYGLFLQNNKVWEIYLNFMGGFIATLIGVYISIYVATEQARNAEKRRREKTFLGSLKLIFSELDINEMNLKDIRKALETMPLEVTELYDNFNSLGTTMTILKTQSFYGTIASGDMREITTRPEIFNAIQQAYFNMEISINNFNAMRIFFKNFQNDTPRISIVDQKRCLDNLQKVKNSMDREIKIIERAKKIVLRFLEKNGVQTSQDQEILNMEK